MLTVSSKIVPAQIKGNQPQEELTSNVEFSRKLNEGDSQMKASRYSGCQILPVLKQAESGRAVPDLCREHDMRNASFYQWRTMFRGMDASLMKRMKELTVSA